jgi:hypothetical protein
MNSIITEEAVKLLNWFNCYTFMENNHSYYYKDKRVKFSVTQFIKRFFKEFDSDTISKRYAEKHGLNQQEVLDMWKRNADISALSGTAIHSYLENAKRGKVLDIDFSKADELGLGEEVRNRFNVLLPKAQAFHKDTLGKLFPIQLEYTVGIGDFIAGNIDMLCWNDKAGEIQLWDYKNTKEISYVNNFGEVCLPPFHKEPDCNYIHYSIQLNVYKAILQRMWGISIGKMYLVHFDYNSDGDEFEIHECKDFQQQVNAVLDEELGKGYYVN